MNYIGSRWRSRRTGNTTVIVDEAPEWLGRRHFMAQTLENGRTRNISIDTLHNSYEQITRKGK